MQYFIFYLTHLFTLIIGLLIGYLLNKEKVSDIIEQGKTFYNEKIQKEEVGSVHRPSADIIRKRNTIEGQTEVAMEETIENILSR